MGKPAVSSKVGMINFIIEEPLPKVGMMFVLWWSSFKRESKFYLIDTFALELPLSETSNPSLSSNVSSSSGSSCSLFKNELF